MSIKQHNFLSPTVAQERYLRRGLDQPGGNCLYLMSLESKLMQKLYNHVLIKVGLGSGLTIQ